MRYNPPNYSELADMAAIDVSRLTEDEARKMLEDIRWPNGITCPHCGSANTVRINGKSASVRDGLLRCRICRKQFTVTTGTVMHATHITLRQWVQAFYAICSHKKGISALQLQRNLGIHNYESAWHLAHRVRKALEVDPPKGLKGVVEVDETYVGGKPRKGDGKEHKRGRGTDKTPVLAMVERHGNVVSKSVDMVNGNTLKSAIKETVDRRSTIMTDELNSYSGIGDSFDGGHQVVNHSAGEYVKGNAYTNTAECYFSLLKRGVIGTFHSISKKHLDRYCDEFSFRWNNRGVADGVVATEAVKGMEGKRLMYKTLVGRA